MTINELRTKRATLWNTMEGFLDTHRTDKGVLSAEDDATYTRLERATGVVAYIVYHGYPNNLTICGVPFSSSTATPSQ